jgi:hypothetical protein
MARGKLWSVKGVSPEARDAARAAAQESGQPIGVWVDQAILMNGENKTPESETSADVAEDTTQVDIITILQALEQRVADHADRIAAQLAPVRDSINNLSTRLAQLEEGQSGTTGVGATPPPDDAAPATAPSLATAQQPVEVIDNPVAETGSSDSASGPEDSEPDSSEAVAPASDEKLSPYAEQTAEPEAARREPPAPRDPGKITEADIHAADAALKSELTGLFDDGNHRHSAGLRTPIADPFMPGRPRRRRSRAPLVFVLAILVTACAGIAAVAWFEFLSPEMRQSISSEFGSATTSATTPEPEGTEQANATVAPPAPSIPTREPTVRDSVPPPLAPTETPAPASAPAAEPPVTSPPEAASTSEAEALTPGVGDTAPIPPAARPDATTAGDVGGTGNAELDALSADAATGVATAQNELGVRYLVGRGVAQDYGEAAYWLRKAAAQDMTNAQYNLGVLHDSGRGVEPDPTEALIWFHSAAENGHGRAQMAMAAAYASGRGIARNPDEALKWLGKAAESNVPDAQFSLGNVLSASTDSRESLTDAYYWFRIADANGVANASERADQIAAQLTPEERAGANARISHFISQKIPRAPTPGRVRSTEPAPTPANATRAPAAPEPQTVSAPSPSPLSVSTDQISAIQTLLNQLGFDPGPADGAIGDQTRNAIRNYQRELGLPIDGEPTTRLLAHLRQIAGAR